MGTSELRLYTALSAAISYTPAGGIAWLPLGNGLSELHSYNSRLQPTSISAGSWVINLYPCPGHLTACSTNNGNILEEDVTTPGVSGLTQAFSYDALNRITGAVEKTSSNGSSWSQTYTYDVFGNHWVSAYAGVPQSSFTPTVGTNFDSSNRLLVNNAAYDASGGQTAIGGFANILDAEGRTTSSTLNSATATYAYDGEGRRVRRVGGGVTTQYVYEAQGNLAAEFSTQPAPVQGTEYVTADHLGSTRMVTDRSGVCLQLHDYLPFGEEIPNATGGRNGCYGTSDGVAQKFTGKERDSETNLDFFGARYFSGAQGRFTSADPLGANLLRVLNPQRWNMYAYAINNPLLYTDPDGRDAIAVNFSTLAAGAGHLGTISVHHDGSATYVDYGPRGGGKPIWGGYYNVVSLASKVELGSNRVPTPVSAAALMKELAGIEKVDVNTVRMAYYKTSDAETAALDRYIQSLRNFENGWWNWASLYVVGAHDCAEVCNVALGKAGIGRGSEALDVPNWWFSWFLSPSAEATYSGGSTPDVTSKICYDRDDGKGCQ